MPRSWAKFRAAQKKCFLRAIFFYCKPKLSVFLIFVEIKSAETKTNFSATIVLKNACKICAHCFNSRYSHCILYFLNFEWALWVLKTRSWNLSRAWQKKQRLTFLKPAHLKILKITSIWTRIYNIFRQRAEKLNHIKVLLMLDISNCPTHEPNFAQHKKNVSYAQYISTVTQSFKSFLIIVEIKSAETKTNFSATIVLKNACKICAHCFNSRYSHCILYFLNFEWALWVLKTRSWNLTRAWQKKQRLTFLKPAHLKILKITSIWTRNSNIFRQRAGKLNHIKVLLMLDISNCRAHEPNFAQYKKMFLTRNIFLL